MNAGQLDERIEIKAKKIVENELGEEQPEEITLKKSGQKSSREQAPCSPEDRQIPCCRRQPM